MNEITALKITVLGWCGDSTGKLQQRQGERVQADVRKGDCSIQCSYGTF